MSDELKQRVDEDQWDLIDRIEEIARGCRKQNAQLQSLNDACRRDNEQLRDQLQLATQTIDAMKADMVQSEEMIGLGAFRTTGFGGDIPQITPLVSALLCRVKRPVTQTLEERVAALELAIKTQKET